MITVSRRAPHLAFLCVLCVLSGATILVSGVPPGSIEEALEPWMVTVWGWSLVLNGAAVIVTMLGRDPVVALRRERLMLWPLSLATIAYAIAVGIALGVSGGFPASLALAFAGANFWRMWQITRWLRSLRAGPPDG
jgi:hypothetical protein